MKIPFIPIQGKDEVIKKQAVRQGNIYFATDSGKIYLDTATEHMPIGGSGAAVIYASAKDVMEDLVDFKYLLNRSNHLDDKTIIPKKDDLIINSDGRFFKVLSYDGTTDIIRCDLIAVSGVNNGGNNNPDGGTTPSKYVTLKNVDVSPDTQVYIYGQSQYVKFTATATDDAKITLSYTITSTKDSSLSATYYSEILNGGTDEFDLGSKLYRGDNTLRVKAVGSNSGSTTLDYTGLNAITLALKESKNFNPLKYAFDENLPFYCIPVGEINKTLEVYLNNETTPSVTDVYNATITEESKGVTIPKRDHGVYPLKAVLSYSTGIGKISTDPLIYEVAFVDSSKTAPLIWFKPYPTKIVDHDKLTFEYMVYDPSKPTDATVERWVNGTKLTDLEGIGYSNQTWHQWNISNYKLGTNTFSIKCGNTTRDIVIEVEEDLVRNLETVTAGLFLNLDTLDRSNKENKTSRETWEYKHTDGSVTAVKFNNFNWYNNGWINDPEINNSILRVSNGASIEIPLNIMNLTDLSDSLTFELRFKIRNVQEYENLIKYTAILNDEGEVESVKKEVISEKGVWGKYYNNGIGMCLGTQEGFFKGSSNIVAGRYKEDQILTISFVAQSKSEGGTYPLIYMYIDGVMSSIVTYTSNESFYSGADKLIINSDYCDIDIHKIRIYKAGLSSSEIVQNYLADINDASLYDVNQITTYTDGIPTIDYNKMLDYNAKHPDNPLLPYAVVECVDGQKSDLLPFKKGNKRNLNVTFVNPSLDRAYELGEIDDHSYLCGAPSFTATSVEFDVQGTSSQGYPRRNYKGKFKKGATWTYTKGPLQGQSLNSKVNHDGVDYKGFYMDNTYSETSFTWKADYMESSMTHNTAYASFVNTLYDYHPLEKYDPSIDVTNRRTTIYGFPMLLFQKKYAPDAAGNPVYEFVGRYNFNLDKGCNNVIGFNENKKHPIVDGTYINDDGEEVPIDYEYVAECWELKNNQGGRTAFTYTNFEEVSGEKKELAVNGDFETRYHYYADPIEEAIKGEKDFASAKQEVRNEYILSKMTNLRIMAEWLKSTNTAEVPSQAEHDNPESGLTAVLLDAPVTYGKETFTHDTKEYRLAKFTYEFDKHFDKHYCSVYFIMTEMILAYDSRGKNMMLASWGPQDWRKDAEGNYILDESGKKVPADYIWFPIFYDIDTQLGVNNSGVPSWEYYEEATKNGTFSTSSSVLWVNFYECFKNDILNTYVKLRNGTLNYEELYGYYSYNPKYISYKGRDGETHFSYATRGQRPINIINVDQYYKYIAPTFSGYINTSGAVDFDYGKRFYCLQGNRDLHRNLFLNNRFNFMDSCWQGGDYDATGIVQQVKVRANANMAAFTSDKYLDTNLTEEQIAAGFIQAPYKQHPVDADWTWHITPYLRQYVSIVFDSKLQRDPVLYEGNKIPINARVSDDNEYNVKVTPNHSQQIFYIGGAKFISSLGDLSDKYLDEMEFERMIRLKDLHLGSDVPNYYNNLSIGSMSLGAGVGSGAKTLLESIVLTGVSSLSGDMDVSGSEKLKEFRALNTNIGGAVFADGVQLEYLHLPESITSLVLKEPVALQGLLSSSEPLKDGFNNPLIDETTGYYKFPKGIFLKGITDNAADKTKIRTYIITGGKLGYDSYKILKRLVDIKLGMRDMTDLSTDYDKTIAIQLTDVSWTPYRRVVFGEEAISGTRYKKITENSTLIDYTPDSNWDQFTLNELIYEVDAAKEAEKSVLSDLSLLDLFLDEKNNLSSKQNNYFKDTYQYSDNRPTYPNITGNIFVANSSDNPISEYEIRNHYQVKYPKLNILAQYVDPAYTLKLIEIDAISGQEKVLETLKYKKDGTVAVKYDDIAHVQPSRLHHYFKGWSTTVDGAVLSNEEINALTFDGTHTTYTLYAVFDWDSYTATFYNGSEQLGEKSIAIYDTYFSEPAEVPSREADEALLPINERLAFYGWSDKPQSNPIASSEEAAAKLIIDVTKVKATENKNFYAIFVKENVYSKPTADKYFDFVGPVIVNGVEGYQIRTSSAYNLKGKITIPATHNGLPIVSMGYFHSALYATGIFFMDNVFFYEVGEEAMRTEMHSDDIKLKGVYLPESVMYIRAHAFNGVQGLEHLSEKYVKENIVGHLSDNIIEIGTRAFYDTKKIHVSNLPPKLTVVKDNSFYGAGENVTLSTLPDSVKTIEMAAFMSCPNVQITNFGKKSNEVGASSGLSYIGGYAFANGGVTGAHSSVKSIFIWDSVTNIEAEAFNSYGSNVTAYTPFTEDNIPTGWTDVSIKGASAIGVSDISWGYTGEV